jgi:hypothetical protein
MSQPQWADDIEPLREVFLADQRPASDFDLAGLSEMFGHPLTDQDTFVIPAVLAVSEPAPEPCPPVVCICGSMQFEDQLRAVAARETLDHWGGRGALVFMPQVNMGNMSHGNIPSHKTANYVKNKLDRLHRFMIDLCDEVVVVCPKVKGVPYIGKSVQAEIEYAKAMGKPIRYVN